MRLFGLMGVSSLLRLFRCCPDCTCEWVVTSTLNRRPSTGGGDCTWPGLLIPRGSDSGSIWNQWNCALVNDTALHQVSLQPEVIRKKILKNITFIRDQCFIPDKDQHFFSNIYRSYGWLQDIKHAPQQRPFHEVEYFLKICSTNSEEWHHILYCQACTVCRGSSKEMYKLYT